MQTGNRGQSGSRFTIQKNGHRVWQQTQKRGWNKAVLGVATLK